MNQLKNSLIVGIKFFGEGFQVEPACLPSGGFFQLKAQSSVGR
jgi:hypothetical protein